MEEFQCLFRAGRPEAQQGVRRTCCRGSARSGRPPASSSWSLSQKPSGVGAGDVQRLFNRFRDNHIVRFALRCATRDVSMADPRQRVATARATTPRACRSATSSRASGSCTRSTDDAPTVRTYLADGEDAEVICLAARKLREKARTLSGDALGVELDEPRVRHRGRPARGDRRRYRPVVGDGGRAARRLMFPMRHADATGEACSAAARARGVPSRRRPDAARTRTATKRRGCRKADLGGARPAMKGRHRAEAARHALTCGNAARVGTARPVPTAA